MVISHIIGGLGNQMFQYAIGRSHSIRTNSDLKLDISSFDNYELHQGFELHRIFNFSAEIASDRDIRSVLGWQSSSLVRRALLKTAMAKFRCNEFVVEPYFNYWPGIKSVNKDCYLYGYWQTEKYFTDVANQIRRDFVFKIPMKGRNAELSEKIQHVNAVSLHVRRGDYVVDSKAASVHGVAGLDYYNKAIKFIAEKEHKPHFFIFSDDIDWVRDNLRIGYPCTYVDNNSGLQSYNDMHLMSLCKHNIIANSTFSWWGAWLNDSHKNIIIAPKKWFVDDHIFCNDLIPEHWSRL